jgi:hypothetical protein
VIVIGTVVGLLAVVLAIWVESCRFDWTLLRCVLHRFEFWVFLLTVIEIGVGGPMTRFGNEGLAGNVANPFDSAEKFLILAIIAALDAAPSLSLKLRRIVCMMALIVLIRILIDSRLWHYTPVSICLLFCTDSNLLALSGLLTASFFVAKYLISITFRPQQATLVRSHVLCSMRNPDAHAPASDSPSADASSYSLITDAVDES